jgi:hypothetical protein
MKVKEIPLVGPSGSRITGFLTKSGGICKVRCLYTPDGGGNFFYEVPEGMMDQVDMNYEDRICVDEDGDHWTLTDVQWESAPRGA